MPTPTTTTTAASRPLPGDPAERLQARATAARLVAEELDAKEETGRKRQERLETRTGRAWTVAHAYERTLRLVQADDCDDGVTLPAADQERMLGLLADVDWEAHDRRRWDEDATAALTVNGASARLSYDRHRLYVQIGCPANPDGLHTVTIRDRVQLAWALDHLDQPDLPQWVCPVGCTPTTPTTPAGTGTGAGSGAGSDAEALPTEQP